MKSLSAGLGAANHCKSHPNYSKVPDGLPTMRLLKHISLEEIIYKYINI